MCLLPPPWVSLHFIHGWCSLWLLPSLRPNVGWLPYDRRGIAMLRTDHWGRLHRLCQQGGPVTVLGADQGCCTR